MVELRGEAGSILRLSREPGANLRRHSVVWSGCNVRLHQRMHLLTQSLWDNNWLNWNGNHLCSLLTQVSHSLYQSVTPRCFNFKQKRWFLKENRIQGIVDTSDWKVKKSNSDSEATQRLAAEKHYCVSRNPEAKDYIRIDNR